MRRRFAPWVDCLLWLLVGWLAGLAVTVVGMAAVSVVSLSPAEARILNMAPNLIGISAVLLLGLATARESAATVLRWRLPSWRVLPAVALSAFGLAFLAAELEAWIEEVLPLPERVESLFRQVLEYHSTSDLLGVLLFLVVVAPVSEELMFRGLFLHRLQEGYSARVAVAGSAICFGIFHILPWQMFGAALVGLYLGWLVLRTDSIFVPILAHGLFNLVPVIATGLPDDAGIVKTLGANPSSRAAHLPAAWLLASGLAVVAGILGTHRLTSGSRHRPGELDPGELPPAPPPSPEGASLG